MPSKRTVRYELITPAKAKKYLSKAAKNRKIYVSWVRYLAEEIKSKRWRETHEGIAFNRKGQLMDGQHRMLAIIESGIPISLSVTRNLSQDAFKVINTGRVRNPRDILTANGRDLGPDGHGIIRLLDKSLGRSGGKMSPDRILELADRYGHSIREIQAVFPRKVTYVTTAPIKTVAVRAFIARPSQRRRVKNFCKILVEGLFDRNRPEEMNVHKLREWLIEVGGSVRRGSSVQEVYRKASRALALYLDKQVADHLRSVSFELFPLPEEKEAEKKMLDEVNQLAIKEKGVRHFMIPVGARAGWSSRKIISTAFRSKRYRYPKGGSCCSKIRRGDKVCFYNPKNGVVADAVVKSFIAKPRGKYDNFPYEMELKDTNVYYETPVPVNFELCQHLDVFKNGMKSGAHTLFVRTARTVTARDFVLLTKYQKVGVGTRYGKNSGPKKSTRKSAGKSRKVA